jgi:hypothetical protein
MDSGRVLRGEVLLDQQDDGIGVSHVSTLL